MYDVEYFKKRLNIEDKHYMMVSQWINFFNPDCVLDCGCGAGQYLKAFFDSDVEGLGFDKSKYVIELNPYNFKDKTFVQDIVEYNKTLSKNFDFVLAVDVLEHLNDVFDVRKALKNLQDYTTKFVLVSVPYIGNDDLNKDITHKIFLSKNEWLKLFDEYFEVVETPGWFLYKEQFFVLKLKEDKK